MHTIRLKINDKVYDKLIWLLSKFNKDEVEIVDEGVDYQNDKKYLDNELSEILTGQASFIGLDELEQRLKKEFK